MTKLTYVLSDGREVTTLREAETSGFDFSAKLKTLTPERKPLTESFKMKLAEKFGW